MNKIECTIHFLTPAFLGDANQSGAWRTPPFKAQLRQFWRMVMASKGKRYDDIRRIEAHLFGHAWLKNENPRQSRVRLRLNKWHSGNLADGWSAVGKIQNGKASVDAGLYMGYGAVEYDKSTKGTKLTHAPAIDANQSANLRIGWRNADNGQPEGADALLPALALMGRYGTIGGRSRNGWGSYAVESDTLPLLADAVPVVDWRDALHESWVQGIGGDTQGALIWSTRPGKDWRSVMRDLAQLRSDINRHFGADRERSLLSYPVTKKSVRGWSNNDRLPSSLRCKVVQGQDRPHGLIFHMPCRPPDELWAKHPYNRDQGRLENLWAGVHAELDNRNELQRVGA